MAMSPAKNNFDVKAFLAHIGQGRKIVRVRKKSRVYAQGDACDAVFYLKKGKIKLTVISKAGKEATIAILNPTDFFGKGCLAGQPLRMDIHVRRYARVARGGAGESNHSADL
jgi:CRP-like cAMP-binding protein